MALTQIKLGEKAKPVGVEKYKGSEKFKSVIALIGNNAFPVATHYLQNGGYIYATDYTMKELGIPKTKYVFPILNYTVREFPYDYGMPFILQYLMIPEKIYNDFCEKQEMHGDLTKVDMTVTCLGEKYQDNSFDILFKVLHLNLICL